MDPYLEAPDIWPDFHNRLAEHISSELNRVLPAPYYARLEMRPEVGIVGEEVHGRHIAPDIAFVRRPRPAPSAGGAALLDRPRNVLSNWFEVAIASGFIRHAFVEIRDPSRGHHLITLIEIVSPSNKRPGDDRRAYERKQREVLDSDASLIELDLLRTGERPLPHPELRQAVSTMEPAPDYLVLVNRSWTRAERPRWQLFPAVLAEPLPVFPVPLREGQEEVLLDLQFVFQRAYDSGPYRRGAVDYGQPPQPPLPPDRVAWAAEHVRQWASAQIGG
jgi:hypothetical protein